MVIGKKSAEPGIGIEGRLPATDHGYWAGVWSRAHERLGDGGCAPGAGIRGEGGGSDWRWYRVVVGWVVCGRREGLDRWRSSEMSTRANTPGLFLPLIARFFAGARPTIDLHFKGSPA